MNTPNVIVRKGNKPGGWLTPLKVEQVLEFIPEVLKIPDYEGFTICFQLKQRKTQKTKRLPNQYREVTRTYLRETASHKQKLITIYPVSQDFKTHYSPLEVAMVVVHEFGHIEDIHLEKTVTQSYPTKDHVYYAKEQYAENAVIRVAKVMLDAGFLTVAEFLAVKKESQAYLKTKEV
jgi:hypothetical protein